MDVETLSTRIAQTLATCSGVRVAYLFGSRARGRARLDSDLDIAVAFDQTLNDAERESVRRDILARLTAELGAMGERGDIVDIERAPSAVAFAVIRDGRRILSRSESDRVRVESRVARRHDDEAPRRALFRSAAARVARKFSGSP